MKAKAPNTSAQTRTFKPRPLSSAQLVGIELLLQGHTDQAVGEAVGVNREAVWNWRRRHPVFMAQLQVRRAELYGSAFEALRALLARAVKNLAAAVEAGDLRASIEVLKAVGMYGNGSLNAIPEQDPVKLIKAQALEQVEAEGIPEDINEVFLDELASGNPARRHRLEAIEAELWQEYGEPA